MIGVVCSKEYEACVSELFQLFKTPWEYFDGTSRYEVVLICGDVDVLPEAKLVIVFAAERTGNHRSASVPGPADCKPVFLEGDACRFPLYGKIWPIDLPCLPLLKIAGTKEVVGGAFDGPDRTVIRVGYNLFSEIEHLLSRGQPVDCALIPTVDVHIHLLRQWIVRSGLCVVEIPPIPDGYHFSACLTHDVDFIRISDHSIFDRSVLGFIARSFLPRHWRDTCSRIVWSRFTRNWRALTCLPAVYLGLARDTWFDIDRFMDLERGLASTFYFIPRKGHAGESLERKEPSSRAARYDVKEYRTLIEELKREGAEVGVHGLDAWHDEKKGREEGDTLRALCGQGSVGIRMHWLYFGKGSPALLEQAGFSYDSTVGYNEANGFRSGTTQVFCLPGGSTLLELPLNIMDTALFYSRRMGLSEAEAMELCRVLVAATKSHGGVLTINWHTRSLAPERNWDAFYTELLDLLKAERGWFATAEAAVGWFKMRRQVQFEHSERTSGGVKVTLRGVNSNNWPGLKLRVYLPEGTGDAASNNGSIPNSQWIDVPITSDGLFEVPFSSPAR